MPSKLGVYSLYSSCFMAAAGRSRVVAQRPTGSGNEHDRRVSWIRHSLPYRAASCRCRHSAGVRWPTKCSRPCFPAAPTAVPAPDRDEVAAQIDEQQSVVAVVAEEAQDERFGRQDGAVHAVRPLSAKDGIFAAQFEQVAVKRVNFRVTLPLRKVEFTFLERVAGRPGRPAGPLPRRRSCCETV